METPVEVVDAVDRLKMFQDSLELEMELEIDKQCGSTYSLVENDFNDRKHDIEEDIEGDVDELLEADELTSRLSNFESTFTSPNKQFMKLSEKSGCDELDTPVANLSDLGCFQPADMVIPACAFFDSPTFEGGVEATPERSIVGTGRTLEARVEFTAVCLACSDYTMYYSNYV